MDDKIEYKLVGNVPQETLVYEAIMRIEDVEDLLNNNSNSTILVDKNLKLTKEHEELARNKHIQLYFVEPREVKVIADRHNSILNKPLA